MFIFLHFNKKQEERSPIGAELVMWAGGTNEPIRAVVDVFDQICLQQLLTPDFTEWYGQQNKSKHFSKYGACTFTCHRSNHIKHSPGTLANGQCVINLQWSHRWWTEWLHPAHAERRMWRADPWVCQGYSSQTHCVVLEDQRRRDVWQFL